MKQKTPLIRYYYLIQLIKDKHYPSRRELTKWLEDKDIFLTERTFYRYVKDVKNLYNIPISYCHTHKGYFIDDENEEYYETGRFLQLMQEMITANAVSRLFSENSKVLTYIEFEVQPSKVFQDVFNYVLTATRKKVKIRFNYFSYQKNTAKEYEVKPYFLKQYQNRWYLIAAHGKKQKSFALEHIQNVELTKETFQANIEQIKQSLLQIVGLTNDENQKTEQVVLRFHATQKNYVKSVPIHKSQQEVSDNAKEYVIKLFVKPNFELKQQILKYGASVEVLQPEVLCNEIQEEYKKALKLYEKK